MSNLGLMNFPQIENKFDHPRIRPVETAHIADLIRIADETNLSHWSAQSYLEEMKNADAIMLRLVTTDNVTIGFIVGRTVPGVETVSQIDAEIYNIAVIKSIQKKGFGQLLFNAFMDECSLRSVVNLWLEVRESNLTALAFYEKNGFARVQTRNHFYENPREHAILMKLELK